jgi:hypothetical protein
MFGEATLDVSGTFSGEAIRLLILFAAPHEIAKGAGWLPSECRHVIRHKLVIFFHRMSG